MIGFEYICKLHGIQYKEIAEMLMISKQTINSWTSGVRKIPKKYLPILSQRFKIPEVYFQKEFSKIDEIEIQKMRLKNELQGIDIEHINTALAISPGKIKSRKSRGTDKEIVHSYKVKSESLFVGIEEKSNIKFLNATSKSKGGFNSVSEVLELFKMFTDILADEKVSKEVLRKLLLATKSSYQGYHSEDEFVLKVSSEIKRLDKK